MQFYEKRGLFKYIFIAIAFLIAIVSLIVSNSLVKDLANEERKKIQLWAEANKAFAESDEKNDLSLILKILSNNTTIPTILCDEHDNVINYVNINISGKDSLHFLHKKLKSFKNKHDAIVISEKKDEGFKQFIYYDDSYTLKRLQIYPYVQLSVLAIFVIVSFLALISSKKAEQNKVWVGLSKETAHQLGTPISSLMAWLEYFKMKNIDVSLVTEMEKDVARLQMITDRFSKIGSVPKPIPSDLNKCLQSSLDYLGKRISKKVVLHFEPRISAQVLLSESLFSWVIENLTKNAADAMAGQGDIYYIITEKNSTIYLDITDTGKGIPKSKFKTVFNPGYTTKSRGWGLGLSLVKRIIESYHTGKIYVKSSEIGKGTTFRIELKKA
ncbi:MAG: sensor histidine kinase [Bacteroidetes bacterium]|jgi:two-component system, sporulation sensor kinase D|nr:sensor histidine kinase [Bacteroidota bacterium]